MRAYRRLYILFLFMFPAPASADNGSCLAGHLDVNFGILNLTGLLGGTAAGALIAICPPAVAASGTWTTCPSIGVGSNSVSQTNRTMKLGSTTIAYQLYTDFADTIPFQYPGSNMVSQSYSSLLGGTWSVGVFGKILAGPGGVAPGIYTDTYTTSAQSVMAIDRSPNFVAANECSGTSAGHWWNTEPLTVSVTVLPSCTVSANTMDFGSIPSTLTSSVFANATITAQCTFLSPFSIGLDNGQNASGSQRRMNLPSTTNYINYGLYTDAATTVRWGTASSSGSCTSGAGTCFLGLGTGFSQTVTVYGQVPAQTATAPGMYGDTVVVTLTY